MDNEKANAGLGCALILPSIPVAMFVRAKVLVALWAWFVVPTFDVKPLTAVAAYGLVLALSIAHQIPIPESNKKKSVIEAVGSYMGQVIGIPVLALGTGWILKGWM